MYKTLFGKIEGMRPLGKRRSKWDDNNSRSKTNRVGTCGLDSYGS